MPSFLVPWLPSTKNVKKKATGKNYKKTVRTNSVQWHNIPIVNMLSKDCLEVEGSVWVSK